MKNINVNHKNDSSIVKRAKTIAANGFVKRTGDCFSVYTDSDLIDTQQIKVKRNSEGIICCNCNTFTKTYKVDKTFRCVHIMAVRFAIQTKKTEHFDTNKSVVTKESESNIESSVKRLFPNFDSSVPVKSNILRFRSSGKSFTEEISHIKVVISRNTEIDPVAKCLSDLITGRQLAIIRDFNKTYGVDVEKRCENQWNLKPNELSRAAATYLISSLENQFISDAISLNIRKAA